MNTTVKNRARTAVPAPASSQPGPARTGRPARPARPPAPASRPATAPQARTATRTGPGAKPRTAARPAPRPAAGSGPARLAGQRVRAAAAGRRAGSKTPFILLVVGLLGSGLICLLVVNTTLAAASYRINALQQSNTQAAQQVQELQEQVATAESPSSIEQRAFQLGLRMQPVLNFVDLRNGRSYTTQAKTTGPNAASGSIP